MVPLVMKLIRPGNHHSGPNRDRLSEPIFLTLATRKIIGLLLARF